MDNGNIKLLETLEPWCDNINIDIPQSDVDKYIEKEQKDTKFNLTKRINQDVQNDVQITFDANKLTEYSFKLITELSTILESSEIEVGEFELDIFKVKVNRVKTYEHSLIYRK